MGVEFTNFSVQVKSTMKEKIIAFLHECGGEIRSQAQRNSRRDTSQTAGSYAYRVDENQLAVHIGSDYDNAIWEEFGTGEYAMNGDGRKGYWVYVKGSQAKTEGSGKTYTLQGAKQAVAILRKKGLDAHYTKGKTANRPLFKAFESSKARIINRANTIFGE